MIATLWGFFFWFLLHASAKSFQDVEILSSVEIQKIHAFLTSLAQLLPCPDCRNHAMKYMQENNPVFKSGQDYIDYLFHFHNAVNKRTEKIELTEQEAEDALQLKLKSYGITNLNELFIDDIWLVFVYVATSFIDEEFVSEHYLKTFEKPIVKEQLEATMKRQQSLQFQFLESSCYILPFRNFQCHDGFSAKLRMLDLLSRHANVTNRQEIFKTIAVMYNSTSLEFGKNHRNDAEMTQLWVNGIQNHEEYLKKYQIEQATHKRLIDLQKQINDKNIDLQKQINDGNVSLQKQINDGNVSLQKQVDDAKNVDLQAQVNTSVKPLNNNANELEYWQNVTISLSIVLSIVLLYVVYYYYQHKKSKRSDVAHSSKIVEKKNAKRS